MSWDMPTLSAHDRTTLGLHPQAASSLTFLQPTLLFTGNRIPHPTTQLPSTSSSASTANLRVNSATPSTIPEELQPFIRNSKPMVAAVVGGVLALILLFFVTLFILRRRCRSGPPGTSTSVHFAQASTNKLREP
ncbi:hypothetical protein AB1N83_010264 [Pleurotus pulmonarius]